MGEKGGKEVQRWAVSASVGGAESRVGKMASDPSNFHLRLVPWVGVAALVAVDGTTVAPCTGRAFCFLPLPAETGLPVHVNGYFELSSNRRDIWHGDDMAGEGRIRAEWNKALLEDVVAPTYARMLQRLSKKTEEGRLEWYHSLWPSDKVAEPWASLARRVYEEVGGMAVLYSTVGGGRWATPGEAVYVEDGEFGEDVRGALLEDGQAVVQVPRWVRDGFSAIHRALFEVSPAWFRSHVVKRKTSRKVFVCDRERAVHLLLYALSDLDPASGAQSDDGERYASLCGVPLVPCSDDKFADFCPASGSAMVLVANVQELNILDKLRSEILDLTVPQRVMEHMRCEAMQTYCNVKSVTPQIVASLLRKVLPDGWEAVREARWRAGEDGQPTEAWVRQFWQYASEEGRVGAFEGWPLLPTCDGTLCLLSKEQTTVVDGASVFGERLKDLLSRLGCRMLNGDYVQRREALEGYVWKASLKGVLGAVMAAQGGSMERVWERVGALTPEDKRELRAYLLQSEWMCKEHCSAEDAGRVLRLPIHDSCSDEEDSPLGPAVGCRLASPGVSAGLLTGEYLRVANDAEWEAYKHLGVTVLKLSAVYVECVFPRLKSLEIGVAEEAMLVMMGQLPQLCREDGRFWDRLSHVEFVRTGAGKLARPWELYDPSVAELQDLLEGGELYPAESFLQPEHVAALVRLGLQTSLDRSGILLVARTISASAEESSAPPERLVSRGRSLLTLMCKHAGPLGFGEESDEFLAEADAQFAEELRHLSWVPVLVDPPSEELPWSEDWRGSVVAPPAMVRHILESPVNLSALLVLCFDLSC